MRSTSVFAQWVTEYFPSRNLSDMSDLTATELAGRLGVTRRRAVDLLASRRWPFEQLSRRVVGFDDLPALLDVMSGADTSTTPPLHGVVTPPA